MAGILSKAGPDRASAIEEIDSALSQFLPPPLGDDLLVAGLILMPSHNAHEFPLAFHGYLEQNWRVSYMPRLGNRNVAPADETGATP